MLITYELLKQHNACESQASRFREMFPDGMQPTIENLADLQVEELDVLWLSRLLPAEGIGSARHFALICAEDVAHLCADPRVDKALGVVRRRVANPASVSNKQLAAALAAALAATRAAALAATRDAARAAIRDATLAAIRDAALAATRAAALAATRDATRVATRDAALAAIRAATLDAIRDAARDAVWNAALAATRAAIRDATLAAIRDAARDAAWDAAWGAAISRYIAHLSAMLLECE